MSSELQIMGYLGAALLFVFSLGGLARQETAKLGIASGTTGMALGIGVTFAARPDIAYVWVAPAIAVGAAVGVAVALRVEMTSLPELVAILHSFVGLAAVLVGFSMLVENLAGVGTVLLTEIYVDVAIGAITFTGSVVAWGKLSGVFPGAPLRLPARHFLNLAMVVGLVAVSVPYVSGGGVAPSTTLYYLCANAAIASLLGIHLVAAIGGADMPVVVSLLNSYSGWAAAAAGFMLKNDLLIITGALVGSSGAILSYVMCEGMNRSIWNVVFGGWGDDSAGSGEAQEGDATSTDAPEVAALLECADRVVVVPGYGMAVAQAQHALSRLTKQLRDRDTEVLFGIHPVAGRMPGHMNVLLAEADIPYDIVEELEEVNPKLSSTDVVLVIGANDTVNPTALTDEDSAIAGMPQLKVWEAETVVVMKRSLSPGYAGVPNPLFYRDNTLMYFGDARDSVENLLEAI
jgi:NAD(P) transhydrogenase subunit beta